MSDLWRSSKRGPSALERVKALCESLLLPVSTTVAEVQQLIEEAISAYADFLKLENSVKTIEAILVAAEKEMNKQSADI